MGAILMTVTIGWYGAPRVENIKDEEGTYQAVFTKGGGTNDIGMLKACEMPNVKVTLLEK